MQKTNKKLRIFLCICVFLALATLVAGLCTYNFVFEHKIYQNKFDVAAYIYKFGELPINFLTKTEFYASLDGDKFTKYNVGGDVFYNREGLIENPLLLTLFECDIYNGNHNSGNRGAERLVFFEDGAKVFYTADHYLSFDEITFWDINWDSMVIFGVMGICVLAVLVVALVGVFRKNKVIKDEVVLSLEIVGITIMLFVLSPLVLVMYTVQQIIFRAKVNKYNRQNKAN